MLLIESQRHTTINCWMHQRNLKWLKIEDTRVIYIPDQSQLKNEWENCTVQMVSLGTQLNRTVFILFDIHGFFFVNCCNANENSFFWYQQIKLVLQMNEIVREHSVVCVCLLLPCFMAFVWVSLFVIASSHETRICPLCFHNKIHRNAIQIG